MTQSTFVCKECKEIVQYDFTQKLNENQWKDLQSLAASPTTSTTISDPEKMKVLEQSFVFIDEKWEKLQTQQLKRRFPPTIREQSEEKEHKEDSDSKASLNGNSMSNGNDFAQSLQVFEQILQITAGHAKVDHPLCHDCTDRIVKGLDSQIEELNLEKKTLSAFIAEWEQEQESNGKNTSNNKQKGISFASDIGSDLDEEARLKLYEGEAAMLEKKLLDLSEEKERLKLEFEQLETESLRMNEFEEMFFCDANDFWYSIENLSMQHAAVRQKIREVSSHLNNMKTTNVFDDAFHIYHDGHFGTINGLRLGRLPSVSVEWEEINTGLGQCVLLLDVLAQRCKSRNFKFVQYELYPMGSFSYIKEKKRGGKSATEHHMYGSTGLFGYKQCDKALECFLQCINQFANWINSIDGKFYLRYEIREHQIGDPKGKKLMSIRFAQSTEEDWTQALKYMVIDLKYLLAWVARYSP